MLNKTGHGGIWAPLLVASICWSSSPTCAGTVEDMVAKLKGGKASERADAATELALLSPPPTDALPELRKAMRHKNREVAVAATCAVVSISGEPGEHLPRLIEAAGQPGRNRILTCWVLASLGPKAAPAVPAL